MKFVVNDKVQLNELGFEKGYHIRKGGRLQAKYDETPAKAWTHGVVTSVCRDGEHIEVLLAALEAPHTFHKRYWKHE